ncbi:MAG TPA: hypothetical protein VEY88_15950 [Archangium sp.]|nr:hypothetical protein [Archangium sp.]
MRPEGRRIPDVLLHRYLASMLEGEALERVEKLLAESETDRARLEELRAEASAFLVSHPPGPLVAHIERTVLERKRRRWWLIGALAVPVLTGLAALTLLMMQPEQPPPPQEPEWVVTGSGVTLRVRRREANSKPVGSSDVLVPGDILWFELRAATPGFLAVVGRDATGKVRVYHSKEARAPVPIAKGPTELPPFPLGEAPGNEEVYALFSPTSFELAPVVRALEEGKSVEEALPRGVKVTRRLLRKQREP